MDWNIQVGEEQTRAVWDPPAASDRGVVFVCAHGAGGHMNDRAVGAVARALCDRGIGVVRFNFLYRAKRSGRPDPMPKLVACFEAVITQVRSALKPRRLLLGGRSMGGRAASMLVSEGGECDGLLLLAYPLHPPGHPEKLRSAHLSSIHVPVLCVNGTRDPFCDPRLMTRVLGGLGSTWRMHWLDGADHSFHVLKSSGRTDRDVLAEVAGEADDWVKMME